MKLEYCNVSFRNVLLEEINEVQSKGGIYLPPSASQDGKKYKVIKVGKLCEEVQAGDTITLSPGIRIAEKLIDSKTYYVVFENQIDLYERVIK